MIRVPLYEHIAAARDALTTAGLTPADARVDAEVLARHLLGWDRAALVARAREIPPDWFEARFQSVITRRAAREPVAYIMGRREFWGLDFEVTPDVLIPRPETELIVESALGAMDRSQCRRILDVGTGSGCLAVALACEVPSARVVATDLSEAALSVAVRNARRLGVADRIMFLRADLLHGVEGSFDLVVSNPPYVPANARVLADVGRYEPASALYAGEDGLSVLRCLMTSASARLTTDGLFVVEFGLGQEAEVRELAEGAGWRCLKIADDLQGIARVGVFAK